MPLSALHRQLAAIALGAAARYGFALAGGNALIAHGVVSRFTADVDLFTEMVRTGAQPAYGPERNIRGYKKRPPREPEPEADDLTARPRRRAAK